MGVGEDSAISFDEGGVAGHAEIRLHVRCRVAVGVEQAEAEVIRGACGNGIGAAPNHRVAIGEFE